MNIHNIPQIKHTDSGNFFLLAGPCVVETEEITYNTALKIKEITDKLKIPSAKRFSSPVLIISN